ncbi:hypothetical protein HanRHA438_Chr08g0372911 [Helianthus annuus]|uniref:Uncharacterized protein n=1 Tax=Helianthus annuus TaxID=4232 RepID=A0A251U9K5_HELAN|nr:hypothetical protein HanXRQr2_Chr08g0361371 [Helianthus annuus]KAJ0540447.1 hypothetical protein HanHA300_Chr08g0298321 [Helianthus annuus]KAJ0548995.1 hypothetical protein HanIR_Chr08g0390081 [Helianthus annuus]KAJ0555204.1 hypothetical protein HanHA89_Chr08g0316951 [Helianthus annuus]KAJ0899818.1 hypothetical protein HanRHA438_Chr08g0372911 [Helianthus annuus]
MGCILICMLCIEVIFCFVLLYFHVLCLYSLLSLPRVLLTFHLPFLPRYIPSQSHI